MNRHRVPALCVVGASALLCSARAQVQWQQTAASGGPGVAAAGAAHDTTRGELVVFGGEVGVGYSDATWTWDGATWTPRAPANKPSPRGRPTLCYDPLRDRTVLFGGFAGGNSFLADTWLWNGASWTQVTPPSSPPSRSGASMFFDPVRGTVVMFGGFRPNNVDANDLWEWSGTTWAPIAAAGGPTGRGAHRMVFDEVNGVAILHGGFDRGAGGTRSDTWVLSGNAWATYPGTRPGSLCDQAMAWDAARERVVLFGGLFVDLAQSRFIDLGDTWDWEDGAWQQRTPALSPPVRNDAFMMFDAGTLSVRLSAGVAAGTPIADAWELSAVTPATAVIYGVACPTTAGPAALSAQTLPWLGDTFRLRVDNLPASSTQVLLAVGVSDQIYDILPLPFDLTLIGANGCTLSASMELQATWPASGGTVSIALPLGNDPALLMPWFTQVLIPDFGLPAPLKIAVTEAIRFEPGLK